MVHRLVVILTLLSIMPAHSRAVEPFVSTIYDEAVEKNDYILLHFFAGWCFMCKAQKKTLDPLLIEDAALRKVVFLRVDYEKDLQVLQQFKENGKSSPGQSTLILLKGKNEIARITRETDPDKIVEFLKSKVGAE